MASLSYDRDFNAISEACKPISAQWQELAKHLNIRRTIVDSIEVHRGALGTVACLDALLKEWLQKSYDDQRTWRILCNAIEKIDRPLSQKIWADHASVSKGLVSGNGDTTAQVTEHASTTPAVSVSGKVVVPVTVSDLEEQLHDLTEWDLFAIHLPDIDQHDIDKISEECSGVDKKKLGLYKLWIDKCKNPSWDHVIEALNKRKKRALVAKIENWLNTKREQQATSSLKVHAHKQPKTVTAVTVDETTDSGLEGGVNWDLPTNDHQDVSPNNLKVKKGTIKWHKKSGDSPKGGDEQHLVVAITNEYVDSATDVRLVGIKEDRRQLYKTFDREAFDLLISKDSSKQEMEELLPMISEAIEELRPKQYESAFIIFSGHGGMTEQNNSFIKSEDGQRVSLENLIEDFERTIGATVPKFFLIDACRNVVKDDPHKGAGVNTLHAYATQKGSKAGINEITGSYWIQKVAKLLRSRNGTVVRIIKKANEEVSKERAAQKPVIQVDTLDAKGKSLHLKIDYESSEEDDDLSNGGGASDNKSEEVQSHQSDPPSYDYESSEKDKKNRGASDNKSQDTPPDHSVEKTETTKPPTQSQTTKYLIGFLIALLIAVLIAQIMLLFK